MNSVRAVSLWRWVEGDQGITEGKRKKEKVAGSRMVGEGKDAVEIELV